MNSGKQYVYAFIIFIGLGFMGWYYAQPNLPKVLSHRQLENLPDAIFTQLQVSKFNEQGHLASYLFTPTLMHYPQRNVSTMQQPTITLFRQQQLPWVITANYGKSEQGSSKITLWDQVVLHQAAGATNKESTIRTDKLIYFPKKQFATTDHTIILQQPGLTVTSYGMNAYLNQQRVQLLQQARGQYVKVN